MSDFTPIASQEEFDNLIKDRIERAKESVRKDYADYESIKAQLGNKDAEMAKLTERLTSLETEKADLSAKLNATETSSVKMRIAFENGLPFDFCERLRGNTEEELKADAQELSKLFAAHQPAAPLYAASENTGGDPKDKELLSLSENLKKY